MRLKLTSNRSLIKRLNPKAEMIDVAPVFSRWRTTGQLTVNRHQIHQRTPSAKLHQANRVLPALHRAAEHVAIKTQHAIEVDHAQDDMVNVANVNHGAALE
jgi:hypothetical protein